MRFKPRGWSWVDPTKEVNAYKEAERAGYLTKTDVIAATAGGLDIEDMIKARRHELDLLKEAGLQTDTTHNAPTVETVPADAAPSDDTDDDAGPGAPDNVRALWG